ncbi:ABC transporter ATP-binding protein [Kitasatospora sp. CM 4170]|uniref:ATP-binding cassette domain-containing protein n=1 Tax=Kitasatospora aburaviensis TaxID=67265 RepID=A0ABW1EY18_9ACTN|nr:ABC transporter ATP-binding protein [Kitasatospora sp. CM 4170]WNM49946.1 ABC transporter ATP-binding protein [Kitasatospora sp. CM 4170]
MHCEAVGKRYGAGRWILRDVDLRIAPGEVLAVTGGNGSGKSTLLRILVGLSRPSTGRVTGRPREIGYVPDRFTAHDRLTAASYLAHMGRIRGLSTAAARDRADLLIDRLALVGGREAPLRTLSKGNAQKVALAQALLVPPGLLVLDEPWSGLDASAHGVLGELIDEVAGEGGAVVFTDHREAIAAAHATGGYAIAEGRLTRRGGPGPGAVAGVVVAGAAVVGAHEAVELVLAAPEAGAAPAGPAWTALPGVLSAPHDGPGSAPHDGPGSAPYAGDDREVQVVLADRRHSDAVLLAALQHGWSVRSVRSVGAVRSVPPAHGAGGGPADGGAAHPRHPDGPALAAARPTSDAGRADR